MSDGPDLLERARMALADVGVDPMLIGVNQSGNIGMGTLDPALLRLGWRASEIARFVGEGDPRPVCWACVSAATAAQDPELMEPCEAVLPLAEDCGIIRP